MVEARLEDPRDIPSRSTPSPTRTSGYFASQNSSSRKDTSFDCATPQEYSNFHDSSGLATPTIFSGPRGTPGRETHGLASDYIDASKRMSESSKPDQPKAGSPSHRRRPRLQAGNAQRQPGPQSSQPPQNLNYVIHPLATSEAIHNRLPTSFPASPIHYPSTGTPYGGQMSGYVGQYTMSTQPNPMAMSPPPYAFTHPYHHPVGPENTGLNVHANYPNMLQPQGPVFTYQRPSPEGGSSPRHTFPGSHTSSPMYHQSPSPSSPLPPSSSGQSSTPASSYIGSSPFHSLQYPTPMTTPAYSYPTQHFPTSPMYPPQFTSSPFGQHYSPAAEVEPQGTWYYLPHPSPQQYETGPYQSHYSVGYPQVGPTNVEVSHSGHGPSSANISRSSSSPYPVSPQPDRSHYSDYQTPSDSPGPSGAGPPSFRGQVGAAASAPQSASSGSGRPPASASDRVVVRRSYHPNPPAHRSEWVMWAGNVPSDASHDELWRFFNQPSPVATQASTTIPSLPTDPKTGVLSIFLISRSSCAFINYDTEEYLHKAIARFNGTPLRPNDLRCPRLVCRVRRKDDDLKAGVGAQRGMGMHTRWIREQNLQAKGKGKEDQSDDFDASASPTSASDRLANAISNISMSSDEAGPGGVHAKHSSSSGSYTSTNSSFLARHYPQRYFILKSLTQEDLDLSVERGVWATQRHNEEILDQAFRSSRDVYLVFSVNKSGEFYGYARMSGPVQRGENRVVWASRLPPAVMSSPALPTQSLSSAPMPNILSPSDHRFVDDSPLPINTGSTGPVTHHGISTGSVGPTGPVIGGQKNVRHSAPALLGEGYHLPTVTTLSALHSLDQWRNPVPAQTGGAPTTARFELDPTAPAKAMRLNAGSSSSSGSGSGSDGQEKTGTRSTGPALHSVEEEEDRDDAFEYEDAENLPLQEEESGHNQQDVHEPVTVIVTGTRKEGGGGQEAWGDSFAVEWICTDRLPFHRTKHLRNPWNHDREIKISRDGTELEPSVGQRLLDEWERLAEPPLPPSMGAGKPATAGEKRTTNTRG